MGKSETSEPVGMEALEQELERRVQFFEAFEGEREHTPVPRMTRRAFAPALAYGVLLLVLWIVAAIAIVPH